MINLAPIMFASLAIILLLGFPAAFSLAANGLLFAMIGIHFGLLSVDLLRALPDRIMGIVSNQTLLAIPFFTFMGLILERSGMAEDLLTSIGQLFGGLRGGLAYAVIFVGILLAATTGVVAASVIAMGLISLPVMLRYGYDAKLATGVIAAAGTLAQIIPPGLVLIVLADQLGVPVGDMFRAAILPSAVLAGCYMLFVLIISLVKPSAAPALPLAERTVHGWPLLRQVSLAILPPLALIMLVLGGIFMGWTTPSEGGAMGAIGALALAGVKNRLSINLLRQATDRTLRLLSFVLFILIGSTVFSLVFRGVNGDLWVEHLLSGLPGGRLGFLIVVNILIFFLAFFLDFFEIAFIAIPLLAPVAQKMGIDLVWFGILLAVNMQTSFMHPPFGFSLFYLRSVAPKSLPSTQIYLGALPFVLIQLLVVGLVIAFPNLVSSAPQNTISQGVINIPVDEQGYGDYYLPKEWR